MPTLPPAPDSIAYAPLGMSAAEAARFLGIGTTLFLELVKERRMPRPRVIRSRRVWDRLEITNAFFELPHEGGDGNAIDELKRSKRA
jgi:predicted DNA-binding transcriptional regulator AlpA